MGGTLVGGGATVVGGGVGGAVVGGSVGGGGITVMVGGGAVVVTGGCVVVVVGGAVVDVVVGGATEVDGGCVGTATLSFESSSSRSARNAMPPMIQSASTAPATMRAAVTYCVPRALAARATDEVGGPRREHEGDDRADDGDDDADDRPHQRGDGERLDARLAPAAGTAGTPRTGGLGLGPDRNPTGRRRGPRRWDPRAAPKRTSREHY